MFDYSLYRIGGIIVNNIPLAAAYKVAAFFSDVHYLFADKDRRVIGGNLKVIFPDKPDKEIFKIRRQVCRNFAKYLVDFFRMDKIDQRFIDKYVKLENLHYFDELLKQGKGVIVLSAHLGNWELGAAVMGYLGYPFWAVALEHKDPRVNDFFNRQRNSKNVQVIPFGRAARQCLRKLSENKLLGLVGDRDFSEKGITADFFGKPCLFPQGPAVLALKTGACIVPTLFIRQKDDTFVFKIEKPIQPVNGATVLSLTNAYKSVIEEYIRQYPEQWYMFRRFWIE